MSWAVSWADTYILPHGIKSVKLLSLGGFSHPYLWGTTPEFLSEGLHPQEVTLLQLAYCAITPMGIIEFCSCLCVRFL
jgi:hypothetical protein